MKEVTVYSKTNGFAKTFQLFGLDIQPTQMETCMLIEINKGPDVQPKSEADRVIKEKALSTMWDVILTGKSGCLLS